jgi:hypothetical protein
MVAMTEIDGTDTVGRINRGTASALAKLEFDETSSTEVFHIYISMGT